NGCQFNMSMNFYSFISPLSRLAGAKVVIFFYQTSFFEIIFEFISKSLCLTKIPMNSLLRGANIENFFHPFQIFLNLF
ncbi:hypothetical protein, partial [Flavobacterium sp.]|uniref:hypothetical protein n=1 Tax=Flavobacterium sp. TaxID=239 RepID=UPI002B4B8ABA